nr:unnamed protein product [Callosobruchus chinensis]
MAKISHENNSNPTEDKVNDLTKINGNTISENIFENNDSYDSESDALVIDESLPKKKKHQKKNLFPPQLSAKIYLKQLNLKESEIIKKNYHNITTPRKTSAIKRNQWIKIKQVSKRVKAKQKPKLKEYAQYLGLQPNVQFKCSKCGKAGFESLTTLHEHLVQCNAERVQETSTDNTKTASN